MQQSYFFRAHPWDLDDAGIEQTIAMLAGDVGVDAVSVFAVAPEIHEVRPLPLGGRWSFASPAAAHFQPEAARYAAGHIRPVAAAWMKSRNPLERIAAAAQRERLALRARINCCTGRELVRRNPHAACVNAFGDTSETHVCPANPEVRQYLISLAEDLATNYALAHLEMEAFGFPAAGHRSAHACTTKSLLQAIWSWCFCAACLQRAADAGIDGSVVRAAVLETWRLAAVPPRVSEDEARLRLREDPRLTGYRQVRRETVLSLVRMIAEKTPCGVRLNISTDDVELFAAPDASAALDVGFMLAGKPGDAPMDESLLASIGGPTRCDRVIRDVARFADGPSLVSTVHQASQSGFAAIGFCHFGAAPEPCLDWVRQAIRYARREAGAV